MSDLGVSAPTVGVVMGSQSDWPTMEAASLILDDFNIAHETRIVSAHRTPTWLTEYAETAEERGLKAIIAGAGGAAHLPGMLSSHCQLPVFGVPIQSRALQGLDSLLSIVQMPGGVPVATFSIGPSGAKNAALQVVRMFATTDESVRTQLTAFNKAQSESVLANVDPREPKQS
ncbi:MAG: 5-(carboxyamino)imidazole ribonucleotide mutase [Planctomycetaceae bacterium]